jgi:Cu+-exporting ATPase
MTHACCHTSHGTAPTPAQDPAIAIDPVCGMKVKIEGAKNTTVHEGRTYYFCNPKCLQKFTTDPVRYLKLEEAPPAAPVAPGTIFTCPMHPEIRQVGPGSLPDLRHGAGARRRSHADDGPNRRTRRT